MKKFFSAFLCLLFTGIALGQHFNVASFNIRLRAKVDGENMWDLRKHAVSDQIRFHEFDIFGVQEAFKEQLDDLATDLPEYAHIGVGRDDGAEKGEYSAILYRIDRFKLLKQGTFWLSGTDTEKPNKGWDAALPRICTWGIFQDKRNGKKFIMMNTHFDHVGVQARVESAKLMMAKAREMAKGLPLIITGDFNVDEHNPAYFILANSEIVKDVYNLATIKYEPNSTFNAWGKDIKPKGRIDHIFVSKPFTVRKYGVLTDTYMGKFTSDHFPVMAELNWK